MYDKTVQYWNKVFQSEELRIPSSPTLGIEELDRSLDWLIHPGDSVLDFGCGNGTMLLLAGLRGAKRMVGIDLSEEGIATAEARSEHVPGSYDFHVGGVDVLATLPDASFDAIILSNILDNLTPEDSIQLLDDIHRLMRPDGRMFWKLNPHLTASDIERYDIRVIEGDLLDDGLLLWNRSSDEWIATGKRWFHLVQEGTVYFPQHDATNRIFHWIKV
jgi:cyclopropane fatty-acyl-phospholipid synthase-like methyltransferase